jgi:hypothetical protein
MPMILVTRKPSESEQITIVYPGSGEIIVDNVAEAAKQLGVDEDFVKGSFYTDLADTDIEKFEMADNRDEGVEDLVVEKDEGPEAA